MAVMGAHPHSSGAAWLLLPQLWSFCAPLVLLGMTQAGNVVLFGEQKTPLGLLEEEI